MREYETIFVLDPDVDESQVEVEVNRVRDIVTGRAGEITEVQKWGRRKLAYEINRKKEGIYTLVRFQGGPEVLSELNRRYRLNENLLRHLTVLYEGPIGGGEGALEEGSGEAGGAAPSWGETRTAGRDARPAVETVPPASAESGSTDEPRVE
jgi:small subunit ribosomal protein S6